jgi:hypothetical protein
MMNDLMNYPKRHLNWTWLLSYLLTIIAVSALNVYVNSYMSPKLLVYLDEKYTELLKSSYTPNLDTLEWSPLQSEGRYQWQESILVYYLYNKGNSTINVKASDAEKPGWLQLGINASSDTVILKPKERSPIIVAIRYSPELFAKSSPQATRFTIYFHVSKDSYPIEAIRLLVIWIIWAIFIVSTILCKTEGNRPLPCFHI